MGTDAGEPDGHDEHEPARRRTSFVPPTPARQQGDEGAQLVKPRGDAPQRGDDTTGGAGSDTHDDDELAGALEHEVSRLTASLPIIRPESLFIPVEPPYEPRSDEEREIAREAEQGDTLAAIEHLEALLAVRRTDTAAIPVQGRKEESERHAPVHDEPVLPAPSDEEPVREEPVLPAPSDEEPSADTSTLPDATHDEGAAGTAPADVTVPPGTAEPPQALPPALTPAAGPVLDEDVSDDADDVAGDQLDHAPIATPRVRPNEGVLTAGMPEPMPIFAIEQSGSEPTPLEYRVGRASRLFWLWFAAGASVLVIGVGAVLVAAGLNIVQVTIAAVLGIALSFLPLGLGALSGVWSGQPTVIVSRATFGVVGNVVPAALVLIVRVFWAAALLWLLAVATADTALAAGWTADRTLALWAVLGVAAVVCVAVALVGYALVAVVQVIAMVATSILAIAIMVVAWPRSGWGSVVDDPFGPWIVVVEGGVLVFSILGLAWASAGGDLARYQRVGSGGTAAALWGGFGASLPMLVLVVFGALVAIADPARSAQLGSDPVRLLVTTTPHWFATVVIAAVAVGLMSAVIVGLYSGGFAVQAVGIQLPRWASVLALGVVVTAGAAGLVWTVPDVSTLVLAYPTTLAVPVAAWVGIFLGDFVLRRRRLATDSLLRRGGVYPDWRWVNVIGLVVITVLGLGFMRADVPSLRWEGYLYRALGVNAHGVLAASNIGVLIALLLGIVLGLLSGRRAVPAQETASR